MSKQPSITGYVLGSLSLLAMLALPAEAVSTADEPLGPTINHLLKYVEDSHCVFMRNGTEYNSEAAAQHLKAKYEYFTYKLKTPEDFIEVAGTKSMVSGKPYWVRCDGHVMPSAEWLTKELSNYRTALRDKTLTKERF